MKILFCTSDKVGARLIRSVTWSDFSHVAILNGESVIEAVYPKVRKSTLKDLIDSHSLCAVVDIPCEDEAAAMQWAYAQIGKDYDTCGMLGIGVNRDWQDEDKWWCSELVAASLLAGGLKLFRDGIIHRVTPQHLWMLDYPTSFLKGK